MYQLYRQLLIRNQEVRAVRTTFRADRTFFGHALLIGAIKRLLEFCRLLVVRTLAVICAVISTSLIAG